MNIPDSTPGVAQAFPPAEVQTKARDAYCIISPARNEEEYLRNTLDSVLGQSVLPQRWIIIDSTLR